MQRLCEAFKKAKDGGQKHVTVNDFREHIEGLEWGALLEILKNQGVQKGIIEIDTNVIRPTPYGIEKFNRQLVTMVEDRSVVSSLGAVSTLLLRFVLSKFC